MAKSKKEAQVTDYRYDEKRKNNPPVGLAEYEMKVKEPEVKHYAYDPHLSPQLVWAAKPGLNTIEVEDKSGVEVETVSLHVHERVSTKAIINAVKREEKQIDLFADPKLPFHESVKFYHYDVDWTNRLMLGDSLLVANSLIEREMMAGKVQMIYMDPPYGVKYSSNFQARIDRRDVKDRDEHLTREPEMIKAYRDTWKLGIHSYLTYMRDRLRLFRELLTDSGSIFVQISDENIHLVRCLLDEVFGSENFVSLIPFRKKTMPLGSKFLESMYDYLLWYAKNKETVKYHHLYAKQSVEGDFHWTWYEDKNGNRVQMTPDQNKNHNLLPANSRVYRLVSLWPASFSQKAVFPVEFMERKYIPPAGQCWPTNEKSMQRIISTGRVQEEGKHLRRIVYLEEYQMTKLISMWSDTTGARDKNYVVETNPKVIERCLLMTTDPGDLVFDPTCGSGTTAYVAEQWGRRWITCDTSRVALAIARQRLLTATFPYYKIDDDAGGQNPGYGFKYKTVPHITLKCIAQNTRIDPVAEQYSPLIQQALDAFNKAHGTQFQEWEMPFDPDVLWSEEVTRHFEELRRLKREKQQKIDAIIAEDAPQETLYDQPEIDRKITRVSGPFTVEAIPPPIAEIAEAESPIEGAPEELETFETGSGLSEGNHIPNLIELLRKDGVTFPDNRRMAFDVLKTRTGGVLHAEGEAEGRRVAVSFGPLHGPVPIMQVQDGLREANSGGYDDVIFCGFAFDPEAHATILANPHPRVKAHASHIRPDILLTNSEGESLLKTTASSQLFTVFGEPDIELQEQDGEYTIHLLGVDVYDPIDGVVHSENADRVAAWFVDTDYDGQTFCIVQAFFPDKSAWKKIERALKGTLDEERFDLLTGQVSLPFTPGKHKKVAVKVIDLRGNEVMKVIHLEVKY